MRILALIEIGKDREVKVMILVIKKTAKSKIMIL